MPFQFNVQNKNDDAIIFTTLREGGETVESEAPARAIMACYANLRRSQIHLIEVVQKPSRQSCMFCFCPRQLHSALEKTGKYGGMDVLMLDACEIASNL